jgi:hypothetical protein
MQEISVYLPFEDYVSSFRYHPFSSAYPYPQKNKIFCWSKSGFVNPETISELNANFIITNRNNFEVISDKQNSSRNQTTEYFNAQMRAILNKTLFLDTVIGNIRVYNTLNDTIN